MDRQDDGVTDYKFDDAIATRSYRPELPAANIAVRTTDRCGSHQQHAASGARSSRDNLHMRQPATAHGKRRTQQQGEPAHAAARHSTRQAAHAAAVRTCMYGGQQQHAASGARSSSENLHMRQPSATRGKRRTHQQREPARAAASSSTRQAAHAPAVQTCTCGSQQQHAARDARTSSSNLHVRRLAAARVMRQRSATAHSGHTVKRQAENTQPAAKGPPHAASALASGTRRTRSQQPECCIEHVQTPQRLSTMKCQS